MIIRGIRCEVLKEFLRIHIQWKRVIRVTLGSEILILITGDPSNENDWKPVFLKGIFYAVIQHLFGFNNTRKYYGGLLVSIINSILTLEKTSILTFEKSACY